MATTTSITTTYPGDKVAGYISAALLSANTIQQGGVTVKPNIKFKEIVKKLAVGDLIKDGSCDFDATGNVVLTERYLEPKELQVNLQLCKKDFRSDYDAISMGYSAHDNLPPTFQDYLVAEILSKVATENEAHLWQGTDVNGQYEGFINLLENDANLPAANELTGAAITSTNVITELGKVVDAIPSQLYGNEDLRIYVPQNVWRAYKRALGESGYVDRYSNQDIEPLVFDGVKLLMANGLPDNVMVAAETSNLFFGTGLFSDWAEMKIIDMADIDGSQNVRFIMRMTAGVQYNFVEEIVTYGITNAAN